MRHSSWYGLAVTVLQVAARFNRRTRLKGTGLASSPPVPVRSPPRPAFDDGKVREVELTDELWGSVLEPPRDPEFFARVGIDHGTVVWPNGVDLDPVVLHGDRESAASKPKAG
jgi:hypothetical protein